MSNIKYIPYEKLSAHYWLIVQNQIMRQYAKEHPYKVLYSLTIGRLISTIEGWAYRFKRYVLKIPIIWYVGRNKGTMINAGKPNFIKPVKWTKCIVIGKKYSEIEVTK